MSDWRGEHVYLQDVSLADRSPFNNEISFFAALSSSIIYSHPLKSTVLCSLTNKLTENSKPE